MVDKISKEKRSKVMSAIHSTNTAPELKLRKALFAKGYRYRIHYGKNKIDVAFPSKKVAIFIDGCFWHGCPIHSHMPKSNQEYWIPKLQRNIRRDKLTTDVLTDNGWVVLRVWEHELERSEGVEKVADRISSTIEKHS